MIEKEIVNKVAKLDVININLSDYAPKNEIVELDLKQFLFKELILKEKEFREEVKSFNFDIYKDKIAALFCSSDTIIPMWAYMLITTYLTDVGATISYGSKQEVLQSALLNNIKLLDETEFKNKRVLVNGCSKIDLSESLFIAITEKLQKQVKSLMFGEACSAVPIYKKRK
tara:strand:+ start:258 stop:770 length:513 start_codon:yes stop_codon:yes gene_type:complete